MEEVLPALSDAAKNVPHVVMTRKHAARVPRPQDRTSSADASASEIRQIRWGKISSKPHRNIVSFNLELKQLSESADLNGMLRVLGRMRALGLVPDVVTYATCLQCCRKLGALNEASLLFERMAQEEVEPDQYVYSIMISIFGHASPPRVRESLALFEEMRNAGFRPNTVTCNVLLDACARGCEVLCALQVYGFMKENNVKFDEMTFCAMSRVYLGVHMFRDAEEMLKLMRRSGLTPSISSYNLLLERMRKAGKNQAALDLFERLCNDDSAGVAISKGTIKQAFKAASGLCSNAKKNAKAVRTLYAQLGSLGVAPARADVLRWTGVALAKPAPMELMASHATNRIPCRKLESRREDADKLLGR
ncbi:Pentatricopeptide repeat-containing protein [Porphyridium purpureum]|uniref:Pentatricopeptide repeat-containing protein n=1 Tax=Porphyridium purpureum TaxID=35688 RepID=A0A5J4YK82_PORPP|nr:Pentatricopeptide repeat-containing protein [Porphyridium purpureum]|eukprot:POR0044..scf210_14